MEGKLSCCQTFDFGSFSFLVTDEEVIEFVPQIKSE
jgi:hypothetical protein